MNAAALASRWIKGGQIGARETLSSFREGVGSCNHLLASGSLTQLMLDLSRLFSPYQHHCFDINPLRKIISELIDFEALRSPRAIRLSIGATRFSSGMLEIFERAELSTDALLPSACLPTLSHSIEIDEESYWDGG
jgi:NTE family protein